MIYVSYIPFNRRKAVGWILAAESGQQFVERNQITIRSAEFFVVIWLDYMPEASWDVEAEIFIQKEAFHANVLPFFQELMHAAKSNRTNLHPSIKLQHQILKGPFEVAKNE